MDQGQMLATNAMGSRLSRDDLELWGWRRSGPVSELEFQKVAAGFEELDLVSAAQKSVVFRRDLVIEQLDVISKKPNSLINQRDLLSD